MNFAQEMRSRWRNKCSDSCNVRRRSEDISQQIRLYGRMRFTTAASIRPENPCYSGFFYISVLCAKIRASPCWPGMLADVVLSSALVSRLGAGHISKPSRPEGDATSAVDGAILPLRASPCCSENLQTSAAWGFFPPKMAKSVYLWLILSCFTLFLGVQPPPP